MSGEGLWSRRKTVSFEGPKGVPFGSRAFPLGPVGSRQVLPERRKVEWREQREARRSHQLVAWRARRGRTRRGGLSRNRRRGPRRQALLCIPTALRARRCWLAAPGAGKRVWHWPGAPKKFWRLFWPTPVARSARERGGLLVVRSQGVMAREIGKRDCQAEMVVVG